MAGAWGAGIATFAGDRVLEVFYPDPQLETPGEPGFRELSVEDAERHGLPGAQRSDDLRGVRQAPVLTAIADLASPPEHTADAYLRLHLLSHRLIKPHDANMNGIFGVLPNVAWTSLGPVDPADLTRVQLEARAERHADPGLRAGQVPAHDRLRGAERRADRRRRPRPPRRLPRRRHDGHARGLRELQRRHARALDGRGPDLRRRGGRRRLRRGRRQFDHGHAVRRRQRGHQHRRALPARRQRRDRHQPRRRLHGRGRALRHRRHAGHAARRRGRQGP